MARNLILLVRRSRTRSRCGTRPRCWSWSCTPFRGVTSRNVLWSNGVAEVLGRETGVSVSLYARSIEIGDAVDRAVDHVKAPVWRVLIQTHLKLLRLGIVIKAHSAKFDIEN